MAVVWCSGKWQELFFKGSTLHHFPGLYLQVLVGPKNCPKKAQTAPLVLSLQPCARKLVHHWTFQEIKNRAVLIKGRFYFRLGVCSLAQKRYGCPLWCHLGVFSSSTFPSQTCVMSFVGMYVRANTWGKVKELDLLLVCSPLRRWRPLWHHKRAGLFSGAYFVKGATSKWNTGGTFLSSSEFTTPTDREHTLFSIDKSFFC